MVMTLKTYARIQDGAVAEVIHTDASISTLFHPGMTWIDVSGQPTVGEGWTFDGTRFAPAAMPVELAGLPTMPEILADLASLKAEVAAMKAQVTPSAKNS